MHLTPVHGRLFFIIKVEFKKHLTKNIQKEYVQMIFTLV